MDQCFLFSACMLWSCIFVHSDDGNSPAQHRIFTTCNGNLSPDPMPLFFWLYRCSQSDKLLAEASNYRYHCRFLCAGSFVSISHKDKCSIGHGLFALQILDCRAIPQFADKYHCGRFHAYLDYISRISFFANSRVFFPVSKVGFTQSGKAVIAACLRYVCYWQHSLCSCCSN